MRMISSNIDGVQSVAAKAANFADSSLDNTTARAIEEKMV